MIIDANTPAALAAQSIAAQRDGASQRADAQQPAVDRALESARARTDRANAAAGGAPQTRQAVSSPDTQNQRPGETRTASDRSAAEERGVGRREQPIAGAPQGPAPSGGRGQIVDIFA